MKKNIFLAVLLAIGVSASAQTVEKTVKLENGAKLVYNVEPGTSTKSGVYALQNTKNEGLWMQGNYKNDNRIGTWYFFDAKNKLTMRYNYDQKKLGYLDTAALNNVSVEVLSTDANVVKNASAPLPLCSMDYYMSLLANKLYSDNGVADAEITAHVDTEGNATYSVSYVKENKKSPKKKIDLNSKVKLDWIPSMYNGKPVDAEFTVYATVRGADNASSTSSADRRFRWNN